MLDTKTSTVQKYYCPICKQKESFIFDFLDQIPPSATSEACCMHCGKCFPRGWFLVFWTEEVIESILPIVILQLSLNSRHQDLTNDYAYAWGKSVAKRLIEIALSRSKGESGGI